MLHRIQRQILDLELPREERAYALQQQLSQAFKEKVLPRLNEVFDTIAPEEITLRIPKLEIDLGEINESYWERSFIEGCVEQIMQQLKDVSIDDKRRDVEIKWLKPEEKVLSIFQHFLQAGVLPWYARHYTHIELEKSIKELIQANQGAVKKEISSNLLLVPKVWQRLCWQFSTDFVIAIVTAVKGLPMVWFDEIEHIFETEEKAPMSKEMRYSFLYILLSTEIPKMPGGAKPEPTRQYYYQLFRQIDSSKSKVQNGTIELQKPGATTEENAQRSRTSTPKENVPPTTPPVSEKRDTQRQNLSAITEQNDQRSQEAVPEKNVPPTTPPVSEKNEIASQDEVSEKEEMQTEPTKTPVIAKEFTQAADSTSRIKAIPEEGLLIDNAGLVILGVYLGSLFGELDLVHNRNFKSESDQFKAIHLLHYLANGTEWPEEQMLVLPKILCGLPIAEPVPMDIELQDEEKMECEQLLQAAIRNWPALKNTTPNGLREGFLKREGLLYPPSKRSMWVLRVENKAQDILLNRLPWGFATLKLPWMKVAMQTEWHG